jgi:carboxypeptidase C (cathepsin A)
MSLTRYAAIFAVMASTCLAAEPPHPAASPQGKDTDARLALLPGDAVTQHKITLHGHALSYTATAGTMPLRDQKGDKTAAVFYIAYTLNGTPPNRPVAFFFNGGPGAGSAYMQMGGGP